MADTGHPRPSSAATAEQPARPVEYCGNWKARTPHRPPLGPATGHNQLESEFRLRAAAGRCLRQSAGALISPLRSHLSSGGGRGQSQRRPPAKAAVRRSWPGPGRSQPPHCPRREAWHGCQLLPWHRGVRQSILSLRPIGPQRWISRAASSPSSLEHDSGDPNIADLIIN